MASLSPLLVIFTDFSPERNELIEQIFNYFHDLKTGKELMNLLLKF